MADERISPLLKRVFLFLEDGDWLKADEYCEKVLDIDPENAEAYLGKLMVETMARKREILAQCNIPFTSSLNYQKIIRFGDDELKTEIEGYIKAIVDRNELNRLEGIYNNALNIMNSATDENSFRAAAAQFNSISGYKDADEQAEFCIKKAEIIPLDNVYNYAYALMNSATDENTFKTAAAHFNSISSYKDAAELAELCIKKAETVPLDNVYNYAYALMNSAADENTLKTAAEYFNSISNYKDAAELAEICTEKAETVRLNTIYNYAFNIMNSAVDESAFLRAAEHFRTISGYKNAAELAEHCTESAETTRLNTIYTKASNIMNSARNNENALKAAAEMFKSVSDYKDSAELAEKCLELAETSRKDCIFFAAKANMTGNNTATYEKAIQLLETILGWKDADELIVTAQKTIEEIKQKEEEDRIERERLAEEAAKAAKKRKRKIRIISVLSAILICAIVATTVSFIFVIIPNKNYNNAVALLNAQKYDEAVSAFKALDGYKDSEEKIKETKYAKAVSLMNANKYNEAAGIFKEIADYKDSAAKVNECYNKKNEIAYNEAVKLLNDGKTVQAAIKFGAAASYKDSRSKSFELWNDIAKRDTISAGEYHSIALKTDGTVVATKYINDDPNYNYDDYKGQCDVSGWKDIIAIDAGAYHTVGLKADGTVVAVGDNSNGQCNVNDWTDIVAISAGYSHTLGLRADGTVVTTDYYDVSDWTDIVAVSAGFLHITGLKADGTVVTVGDNEHGQCNVGSWKDITAVSIGCYHTVGLKADGTAIAPEYIDSPDVDYSFNYGQCDVSSWKNIVAISAGDYHTVGLKADGTVVAAGDTSSKCNVSDWDNIVAVSAGYSHTLGLKADGTVVVSGYNSNGQCDVSGWSNIKLPKTTK